MNTLRKERLLLKKLKQHSLKFHDGKIPLSTIPCGLNNYYLKQLLIHNLVYKDYHEQDEEGNDIIDSISINELGTHFDEWRNEERKMFWMKSILTPIGVSIATTTLTLIITWIINKQFLK